MSDTIPLTRLLTLKTEVHSTRLESVHVPANLQPGDVLLDVNSFALTSNNITYAAFGDAMHYWDFFPTGQADWGMMPVWGFATVRASTVPDIAVGERFYGYLPMANFLRVQAGRLSKRGFYDLSLHRQRLPSPYNQYTRCSTDPANVPELEDFQMLLRPLFFTSYMLADFLNDNDFFGAHQVVISSASSKTAYGTAYCLNAMENGPKLIGLTSRQNYDYVTGLGLYDVTLSYDDLAAIPPSMDTLYVDFSGKTSLRHALRRQCGDRLVYDCYAGSAANLEFLDANDDGRPKPQPYFAPNQIRKRNQDWGPEVLARRFGDVQRSFLSAVSAPDGAWMTLEKGNDFSDAANIIRTLCETGGKPELGYTIRLNGQP